VLRCLLTAALMLVVGCAEHSKLLAINEAGAAIPIPQLSLGDTIVVDLESVTGNGQLTLRPAPGGSWPRHLTLRVTLGSVSSVIVRGKAALLMTPIAATGPRPARHPDTAQSLLSRARDQYPVAVVRATKRKSSASAPAHGWYCPTKERSEARQITHHPWLT